MGPYGVDIKVIDFKELENRKIINSEVRAKFRRSTEYRKRLIRPLIFHVGMKSGTIYVYMHMYIHL